MKTLKKILGLLLLFVLFGCGEAKKLEKMNIALDSIKIASNIGNVDEYELSDKTPIYDYFINWELISIDSQDYENGQARIISKDHKQYIINLVEYDGNDNTNLSVTYVLRATINDGNLESKKDFNIIIEEKEKGEFDKIKHLYNMPTGQSVKIKGEVVWTIDAKGDNLYNTFVCDGQNTVLVFRHTTKVEVGDAVIIEGWNSPYGALPEIGSKNGVYPNLTVIENSDASQAQGEICGQIAEINAIDKSPTNFYQKVKVEGVIYANSDPSIPFIIKDKIHEDDYLEITKYSFNGETYSSSDELANYLSSFEGKLVSVECYLYSKGDSRWQVVLSKGMINQIGDGSITLSDEEKMIKAKEKVMKLDKEEIVDEIELLTNYSGVNIHWQSEEPEIITHDGIVNSRPATTKAVSFNVNLSINDLSENLKVRIVIEGSTKVEETSVLNASQNYKLSLFQASLLKYCFFNGEKEGTMLKSSGELDNASDVNIEVEENGFYIKINDAYLSLIVQGSSYIINIGSDKTLFNLDSDGNIYYLNIDEDKVYLASYANYETIGAINEANMSEGETYSFVKLAVIKEAVLFRGIVLTAEKLTGSSYSANYSNEYQSRDVDGVTFTYVRVSNHGEGIQMPKQDTSGGATKPAGDFYNTTPIEGIFRIELYCTSGKTWNANNIIVQVANNADFSDAKTCTITSSDSTGSIYELDTEYCYVRISHTKSGYTVYMSEVKIFTNK